MMKDLNEQMQNNMNVVNDLKRNFDALMEINQRSIAEFPNEMLQNKAEIQKDLNKIKKLVQKNDINGLNKLAKKYANNDPK